MSVHLISLYLNAKVWRPWGDRVLFNPGRSLMIHEPKRTSVSNELITVFLSIFGCPHRHTTFPRRRKDARGQLKFPPQHYIVCLDCGREIEHTLFDPPKEEESRDQYTGKAA